MWEKKRYDIHIRLEPEDIEAINWAGYVTEQTSSKMLHPSSARLTKRFNIVAMRIHNKCVEINRRK